MAEKRYVRNPTVTATDLGDEILLVKPGNEAIYELAKTGAGIWRLLAEPATILEIVDIYAVAFPDIARDQLNYDIKKMIDDALEAGMLLAE